MNNYIKFAFILLPTLIYCTTYSIINPLICSPLVLYNFNTHYLSYSYFSDIFSIVRYSLNDYLPFLLMFDYSLTYSDSYLFSYLHFYGLSYIISNICPYLFSYLFSYLLFPYTLTYSLRYAYLVSY